MSRYNLISLFLLLAFPAICQQNPIIVQGVVVEITDGQKKPVPNITVIVPGESEDVTKTDGSFTLYFPSDKEYISIELEGCPHPIISPYAKRVNIPPNGLLEIKVCAKENERLRSKVNSLNNNIRQLERQRNMTKRQLAAMHQTLLDTIIHFESKIANLEDELDNTQDKLGEKSEQVLSLEKEVASLQERLTKALEVKYKRQKNIFDEVSSALYQYIDQTKNLKDYMRPTQLDAYFSVRTGASARTQLTEAINKYNAARKEILNQYEGHIEGVANYWEIFDLADDLQATYDYALKNVHQEGVYPMEHSVMEYLKQSLNGKSPGKNKKLALQAAEEASPKLNVLISNLEEKTQVLISKLKNNL